VPLTRSQIVASLQNISDEISRDYNLELLGLLGSQSRGTSHDKSDIDIAYKRVDGETVTLIQISAASRRLEEVLDTPIDLIDWPSLRPHYKEVMEKDLISFYG